MESISFRDSYVNGEFKNLFILSVLKEDFRKYKDKYEEVVKEINMKDEIDNINRYLKSLESISAYELENNRLQLKADIQKQIIAQLSHIKT